MSRPALIWPSSTVPKQPPEKTVSVGSSDVYTDPHPYMLAVFDSFYVSAFIKSLLSFPRNLVILENL